MNKAQPVRNTYFYLLVVGTLLGLGVGEVVGALVGTVLMTYRCY